jgi:hypothetical protein
LIYTSYGVTDYRLKADEIDRAELDQANHLQYRINEANTVSDLPEETEINSLNENKLPVGRKDQIKSKYRSQKARLDQEAAEARARTEA